MSCGECFGVCHHKRTYRRLFIGGPKSGQVLEVTDAMCFELPSSSISSPRDEALGHIPTDLYFPRDIGLFGGRFRVYVLEGLEGAVLEQELLRHCLSNVLLESRVG